MSSFLLSGFCKLLSELNGVGEFSYKDVVSGFDIEGTGLVVNQVQDGSWGKFVSEKEVGA